MPFLGQDWRSPGDQWVRNGEGWERLGLWRLKLLESLNENVVSRLLRLAGDATCPSEFREMRLPQTFVLLREVTKEQKMQTSTAEVLSKLDMVGAVHDHRRFNYVCQLVMHLTQQKMSSLSGITQKIIISILEEIVTQATKTQSNLRLVQQLLDAMTQALDHGQYEHVGSQRLWQRHCQTVDKLQTKLATFSIAERQDDGKIMIEDLPDEVLRQILGQLADHHDLINAGLTGSRTFALSEEQSFWRRLCTFHFSNTQWNSVVRVGEDLDMVGWKQLYCRMMRRYGLREVYAEMLHLCRHCNSLFWQLHGHPCPVSSLPPSSQPVSPALFVQLTAGRI